MSEAVIYRCLILNSVFQYSSTLVDLLKHFYLFNLLYLGSRNDVQLKPPKKRQYSEEFGELSTLPDGLAVKVRRDGLVTVVSDKSGLITLVKMNRLNTFFVNELN